MTCIPFCLNRPKQFSPLPFAAPLHMAVGRLGAALVLTLFLTGLTAGQTVRAEEVKITPDPGNLTAYKGKEGEKFHFAVTGSMSGAIWGTDLYTLDSQLSVAAVHAGAVTPGETAVVEVTIAKGEPSYAGTVKNGVTSSAWEAFEGSYTVAATKLAPPADKPNPGNLEDYKDKVGQSFVFEVTGQTSGGVYGTDKYTTDSALAVTAVHAGILKVGETAKVKVTILPGESSYVGTARNGVTTSAWESYPCSYKVEAVE